MFFWPFSHYFLLFLIDFQADLLATFQADLSVQDDLLATFRADLSVHDELVATF